MNEQTMIGQAAKEMIRTAMRQKRQGVPNTWIQMRSARIQERIRNLVEFRAAPVVCGYLAMMKEVQTNAILREAWRLGKRVCVPAYDRQEQRYRPAWLEAEDQLRPGIFRIFEPERVRWVESLTIALALVPGVAFDRHRGRLGHGRGFFDQILADPLVRFEYKLGLAFEFQIVTYIPCEEHDIRMDAVITEDRIYSGGATAGEPPSPSG